MSESRTTALLLAPHAGEPTTRLLVEAAARLGIPLRLATIAGPPGPAGACTGALLPRIGLRHLDAGLRELARLEGSGGRSLNPAVAVARAKCKGWLLVAGRRGLPRPASALLRGGALSAPLPSPFVAKPLRGARGEGIRLVDSAVDRPNGGPAETFLAEERLPVEGRREWRVVVLRGGLLAATERRPSPGEFRSNRARGGSEVAVEPPVDVLAAALLAARIYGLGLAGIDVAAAAGREPVVLDVNDSPGLVGISAATGRDLAGELLVAWLEGGS